MIVVVRDRFVENYSVQMNLNHYSNAMNTQFLQLLNPF